MKYHLPFTPRFAHSLHRFVALNHWFVEEEKTWIDGMKLRRKTTEVENSAIDTHAPIKLRHRLVWICISKEMWAHVRKLKEHDKMVKENEMKIKEVGMEDALAVVRGEFHSHTHERVVLTRPYYALYSKMKREGRMRWMVSLAHEKMNEFRRELDADNGIAVLIKADDCLYGLKEEIDNFGDFDPLAETSEEEEEEELDDLYFGGGKGRGEVEVKPKHTRIGIFERASNKRRANSMGGGADGVGGRKGAGGGGFEGGEALKRRIQSLNKVDYTNMNAHVVDKVEWEARMS